MENKEFEKRRKYILDMASVRDEWFRRKIDRMESKKIGKIPLTYLAFYAVRAYGNAIPKDLLEKIKNLNYRISKFVEHCEIFYKRICDEFEENYALRNSRNYWWIRLRDLEKISNHVVNAEPAHTTDIALWKERWWDVHMELLKDGIRHKGLVNATNSIIQDAMKEMDNFFKDK